MSAEAARTALVTRMVAAVAAYVGTPPSVQYPNRNLIDPSKQIDPWVDFGLVNITGNQLDLNPKPMSVQYGQIVITAFAKENAGDLTATQLLDYFLPYFELQDIGIVRTHSGMYAKSVSKSGWEGYPVTIPFWWTRIKS